MAEDILNLVPEERQLPGLEFLPIMATAALSLTLGRWKYTHFINVDLSSFDHLQGLSQRIFLAHNPYFLFFPELKRGLTFWMKTGHHKI